ncbi:hypothetical protein D3M59_03095 [Sphingomonas edaphi]|uniref:Calcineurin-like phosphoesterase domain-containing protein n=2 Tax=Sphingomonas edaphi TaxID=2315689 RepID=A0A418Q1Z8_9SPHN|nr:hypothetical protein D3M59_03095 [Sphingomonas edaphi]
MLRLWVWPFLALLMALLGPSQLGRTATPPRIVAVGDLHGDRAVWLAIARAAGIIDSKGKWAGGNTIFVQLGDVADRGPDTRQIVEHLKRLQKEAAHRGGQVVALVGNHEAMNMTDDLRYVDPGEFEAFVTGSSKQVRERVYSANRPAIDAAYRASNPQLSSEVIKALWFQATPLGKIEHQIAWKPTGEIGRWVVSNPAVTKIGDTLFVHGGISAAYSTMPLGEINRRVAEALKAQDRRPEAIINDPRGPLWYRGLVTREPLDETTATSAANPAAPLLTIDQEIGLVLNAYGVKRIVVGHTPSLKGIVSIFGGKLWRTDSGNSRAYGGVPSYLEISGDRVVAHPVPRP